MSLNTALTTKNMTKKESWFNRGNLLIAASTLALVVVGALTVRLAAGSLALAERERALQAETDRWTGLAEYYAGLTAARERALKAETARWTGLAEYYAGLSAARERALKAETARWTGLAAWYAAQTAQAEASQTAYAAHYTGLALAEYARTGDPSLLPTCISEELAAQLPTIGDDSWRAEVETCGE